MERSCTPDRHLISNSTEGGSVVGRAGVRKGCMEPAFLDGEVLWWQQSESAELGDVPTGDLGYVSISRGSGLFAELEAKKCLSDRSRLGKILHAYQAPEAPTVL